MVGRQFMQCFAQFRRQCINNTQNGQRRSATLYFLRYQSYRADEFYLSVSYTQNNDSPFNGMMLTSNGKPGSTEDRASLDEARAAIDGYTRIVEHRLKPSLDAATTLRDKAFAEIAELKQMSNALHILKLTRKANKTKNPEGILDESGTPAPALETRVNIGEEFYVRAHVYDLENVIVDLGLGVMVEMTADEAETFAKERLGSLEDEAKRHSARISEIQAHLESITECLSELEISTHSVESLYGHATVDE